MQNFLSGEGGEGGGGGGLWVVWRIYWSFLWFNITLYLVCRGPKYHWSVSPEPVPRAPQNWPKSHGIFFSPLERKAMEQSSKVKVLWTPHRILNRILKQIPSVRGEPAATRFIVCNFTLPSPWPWVIGIWMIAKAHWCEQQLEFSLWFWNYKHGQKSMVGVRVASHWINVFLVTSECPAVLRVLTHPHVLPETHRTKNTYTDKATNVSYLWCTTGHHLIISLTHVGPDLAGHQ